MKIYKIPCEYRMYGVGEVEAETLFSARQVMMKPGQKLPSNAEYMEDSLDLANIYDCLAANGWTDSELNVLVHYDLQALAKELQRRNAGLPGTCRGIPTERVREYMREVYGVMDDSQLAKFSGIEPDPAILQQTIQMLLDSGVANDKAENLARTLYGVLSSTEGGAQA